MSPLALQFKSAGFSGVIHLALLLGSVLTATAADKKGAASAEFTQLLKQKVVTDAVGSLLNNQLPLKLDASVAFPTVRSLPGGPFLPQRLPVTAESMTTPLPPGDYSVPALAFCSEYSVHRAGAGVAYQIGPLQGRAADAIGALYWRGTVEKRLRPRTLLVVGWAIQAGVTYAKMTKPYQAIVDEVIPDYRSQLGGDFVQNLEDLYTARAKDAGLPPLPKLLAGLGKPGELVLTANRQRQALLRQNTNDQIKDQVLFAGQEQRMAPVKPEEGPWTEKIPGVAYVRYRVVGGNVRANNEIQIRILPTPAKRTAESSDVQVEFASFIESPRRWTVAQAKPKPSGPSVRDLTGNGIGYSTSRAAQALYFVPSPDAKPKDEASIGKVNALEGSADLTRDGTTRPLRKGDEIRMGDLLTTGDNSRLQVTLGDNTQLTLAEKSKIGIDDYVYSPTSPENNRAVYNWYEGGFRYVSGMIAKKTNPDVSVLTPYGHVGVRGTEFIGRLDAIPGEANIKLITGALECSPRSIATSTAATGPTTIDLSDTETRLSPLPRTAYDAARPAVLIR